MAHIHDSLLTGYEVNGADRTIVLHTQPHQGAGGAFKVLFSGVVAYHFDGDCLQNIVFDVTEVPAEAIIGDGAAFAERHRIHGWPGGWDPDREEAKAYFTRQRCRCFEVDCSYGMRGWVAAETMEIVPVQERSRGDEAGQPGVEPDGASPRRLTP